MSVKRTMEGFKMLVSVDEALRSILDNINVMPDVIEVNIQDALGMPVAEDVIAPLDVPPFDRSAVDGYAVRSSDTLGATLLNPVRLRIVGEVQAGDDPSRLPHVGEGEAAIIYTGAPLPPGADAVVMAEDASRAGEYVEVKRQVTPYMNVSRKGEDFTKGKIVIRRGYKVQPWHVGALASLGIRRIKVFRRLRVAVLSTGTEVVELDDPRAGTPGTIINSTKPMLISLLRQDGFEPIDMGTVPDDVDMIKSKISEGLRVADAFITTGGTSLGAYDLVPDVIARMGKVLFNGVRMRPGKPTGAGIIDGKPVFMLSGFPVASLTGYITFVRPTLRHITGTPEDPVPIVKGKITRRVANVAGIRTYLRVRVYPNEIGELMVEPLAITASGVLSTLTDANAILILNENVEGYDASDEVEVMLISPLETY
ncbi:molybdopterin molybdotransferase MoeA [Acidilobus sp.]|uniref:molybdopterin molybdotransferase MoeA n=1 Tax=Acidilobus sp. TaxID=1872109 RepID=UPI003CFE9314